MDGLLFQGFVYLCAAVVAVPVAKRLGLGSVLGYLIAGILIGPVIGLVGAETEQVQHVAELGVVMLLFLIGLELEPRRLWEMRTWLLGLGGLQVLTTAVLMTLGARLVGLEWGVALAVGMLLSLSSTAIVLQTLTEKGLTQTAGGNSAFSVLLFQDIAVIPMLALIPLLGTTALQTSQPDAVEPAAATMVATHVIPQAGGDAAAAGASAAQAQTPGAEAEGDASAEAAAADPSGGAEAAAAHGTDGAHGPMEPEMSLVDGLSGWAYALVVLGAVAFVVLGGHFLSRPLFRFIASAGLREIFTATALLLVVGIALLMTLVDLSPALGTFLAGVVLADSEFRHELESDIEPFKGLLLGLFFITVGAGIDFGVMLDQLALVLGLTLLLMLSKGAVLYGLARLFRLPPGERWLFTLALAQAGEFGFVLISFSVQNAVLPESLAELLALVVALSMLLTPALFISYERLIRPRLARPKAAPADRIDEQGLVVVAGLGRFGQVVNRMLVAAGVPTVVLDHDQAAVQRMRRMGLRGWYGDASRPGLLKAAGIEHARAFVVAIDDRARAVQMVDYARRTYPHLYIIARAYDVNHLYLLNKAGADLAMREVFESSVAVGAAVLRALGRHPYRVEKMTRAFRRHDEEGQESLYEVWDENLELARNRVLLERIRAHTAAEAEIMASDRIALHDRSERGWTPPPRNYDEEVSG